MSDLRSLSAEDVLYQVKLIGLLPSIREAVAMRTVLLEAAAEENIEVLPEEIQQAANQLRKKNNLLRAEETWVWMENQGLDLKVFEDRISLELFQNKLAQHLFADQVEPYFAMHPLKFTKAALYEIRLDDEDVALELFYSLKEGEITFHEAAQYIQDSELRRKSGYCGFVSYAQLPLEISTLLLSVTPPQLLKPIITAKGIHLIFVEEAIVMELNSELREQIVNSLFLEWIQLRIARTKIL
jgi:parvulin-like peptidyl-prolyl isomerase